MIHFKKLIVVTAAIISIAGTASAAAPSFQTSFTIDKSASPEAQYENFVKTAKASCAAEARRAGYRATENSSWEQRKCERQLVRGAVKASKSQALIAFYNSTVPGANSTRKYASSK